MSVVLPSHSLFRQRSKAGCSTAYRKVLLPWPLAWGHCWRLAPQCQGWRSQLWWISGKTHCLLPMMSEGWMCPQKRWSRAVALGKKSLGSAVRLSSHLQCSQGSHLCSFCKVRKRIWGKILPLTRIGMARKCKQAPWSILWKGLLRDHRLLVAVLEINLELFSWFCKGPTRMARIKWNAFCKVNGLIEWLCYTQ